MFVSMDVTLYVFVLCVYVCLYVYVGGIIPVPTSSTDFSPCPWGPVKENRMRRTCFHQSE